MVNELDSDHIPVLLDLGEGEEVADEVKVTTTRWDRFSDELDRLIGSLPVLTSSRDVDEAVASLTNTIQQATDNVSRTFNRPTANPVVDLPQDIRELIREKNRVRRRWQRYARPEDRVASNRLAAQVKERLREYRSARWDAKLESLSTQNQSLWRMAKALRKDKSRMPPLHGERGIVYTEADKAEAIADSLERQCSPNYQHCDVIFVGRINRLVRQRLKGEPDSVIKHVSPREIWDIVSKLNKRKAPGPDKISNHALKNLSRKGIVAITNIINAALRLRYFPPEWKKADVVVIPKAKQDRQYPQNYRPISLLSTLGKVMEKVILARLQDEVHTRNIIPEHQHGFRHQHSTEHQLLRVVEYTTEGFNNRQATGAVFLDVAKAFDKV